MRGPAAVALKWWAARQAARKAWADTPAPLAKHKWREWV